MSATFKVILGVLILQYAFSFTLMTVTDPKLYLVKVTDHDALCLDGSQAAYYVSKDGDPKKIYLEFEGGGWCTGPNSVSQTLDDCLERTKTQLGSSNSYNSTIQFHDGVLSINQQNNFKDWTRVYLKYCDGSGHQGTRKSPVSYKGTNLYFRGHNATVGQLNSLEKHNKIFTQATHIVVSGGSAGGLAVFLWTNYIKQRVRVGRVWGIADSGIFLDSTNVVTGKNDYKNMFKNLMSITNVEINPPVPECVEKFPHNLEECMFASNLAPHIKAPMFILQSLYDFWSIDHILGVQCISYSNGTLSKCDQTNRTHIEEYHKNSTNTILEMVSKNPNINGYFAPVCAYHGFGLTTSYYSLRFRIPKNSQNSIAKSIQNWMENADPSTYQLLELGYWPDNEPCAGGVTISQKIFSIKNNALIRSN